MNDLLSIAKAYFLAGVLVFSFIYLKAQKFAVTYDFKQNVYHLQDLKTGILDTVKYDMIEYRDDYYVLKRNKKYGMFDKEGKVIFPLNSENILIYNDYIYNECLEDTFFLRHYIYDKKINLIDISERHPVFLKPHFILTKGGKRGVVNQEGIVVLPFEFDEIKILTNIKNEYRFLCSKSGFSGLIDANGNELIPFSKCSLFVLNRNRNAVFTGEEYAQSEYIAFYASGALGIYDIDGNLVIPAVYDDARLEFRNGLFCVSKYGKYGFVNTSNRIVIPFEYDDALPFKSNVASVRLGTKYSLIDSQNKQIIPSENYSSHFNFINGISIFSRNAGKLGMIDSKGKVIVEEKYNRIEFVEYGKYYRTVLNGKVGVIDYYGNEIILPSFDFVTEFKGFGVKTEYDPDNLFLVKRDGKFGVINSKGEFIIDMVYDDLMVMEDFVVFKVNSFYGLMDMNFKVILMPEFTKIKVHNSEWISVLDQEGLNHTYDRFGRKI
ncbi:MAG: WG repeat-containing protein [Flavobacteriales bacterium]|jgi:hypothetical protein